MPVKLSHVPVSKYSLRNLSKDMCSFHAMTEMAKTDGCYKDLQRALALVSTKNEVTNNLSGQRAMRVMKKRLQDRLYQRKHRAQRESQIRILEHDVQALQSEIQRLYRYLHDRKVTAAKEIQRRQQLQYHAQFLVTQFFNVYQNGYVLSLAGLQENFLRSILAANVVGVDLCGVDDFVQQWRLYGQHFELCILEPQDWKTQTFEDQSVMVKVEVMLYIRFSRQTIDMLFPSLKAGHVHPDLVLPLVTGTTSVAGAYTFVVDKTGYVTKLIVSLELLETLRRVLGSLHNVMQLTKGSRITLSSGTITVE